MKKSAALFLALLLVFVASVPCFAEANSNSIYGPYDSFEELYSAYMEAVESNNVEKQAALLEIGRSSLQAEIKMSENIASPQIDPDELYWIQQFPVYFQYGYFENRSDGWTLSLGTVSRLSWTSEEKQNGWNSVYAKFHSSIYWDNTEIMKEQFYCHARLLYSAVETEWNLEPWRTEMNPLTCN